MSKELSKSEFLKRYIDEGKPKKKKNPKLKNVIKSRLKIIDKDVDLKTIIKDKPDNEEEEEEEIPTIAEIIDERPKEIKIKEMYSSSRWKQINNDEFEENSNEKLTDGQFRHDSDSDLSPVRTVNHNSNNVRVSTIKEFIDNDLSPPRKSASIKANSSHKIKHHDSDSGFSSVKITNHSSIDISGSKTKTFSDDDLSPPRKSASTKVSKSNFKIKVHDSDSNLSPVRQRPRSQDSSSSESHLMRKYSKKNSSLKKSPNPKRITSKRRHDSDSDLSPVQIRRHSPPDSLNSSKEIYKKIINEKNNSDSDYSPPRGNSSLNSQNMESLSKINKENRSTKSLKTGLQKAEDYKVEALKMHKLEQKYKISKELSGENAETIIRDKTTGLKRDHAKEQLLKEEKEKKILEKQQKYAEWGKGVEQTAMKMDKLKEDLYEITKPLARYCDDEDLDERLKSAIHEGDPMAEFILKKRQKEKPEKEKLPQYNGPAPPNRYGIRPGYRWDGVDRSNGFEKRYFEKLNTSKASQEEAYLWSIQDM